MTEPLSFLYLIQTSRHLPKIYECLRCKEHILLSFKENTSDTTIFFPNSTWTTGRNKLREYVLSGEKKYDYYIFLDEDVNFIHHTPEEGFKIFEDLINKYRPSIGNPNFDGYYKDVTFKYIPKPLKEAHTTIWHDGMCNAFSHNSFTSLDIFPYVDTFDSKSWWMSQYIFIILCSLHKVDVLVFPNLKMNNLIHTSYPRGLLPEQGFKYACNNLRQSNGLKLINQISSKSIFKLTDFLNSYFVLFDKLNIIDVGCSIGDFKRLLSHKKMNIIGIDPLIEIYKNTIPHHILNTYSVLYSVALALTEELQNFYVTSSLDTSSLNKMEYANITNQDEANKFYIPANITTHITEIKETISVQTKTLNTIIEETNLKHDIIHILKIDAQGSDLDVVKSGAKYLQNILFIVIESIYDGSALLYENSSKFTEDYDYLRSKGFELLAKETLLKDDCDCLYYNTNLVKEFDLNWDKKIFTSPLPINTI